MYREAQQQMDHPTKQSPSHPLRKYPDNSTCCCVHTLENYTLHARTTICIHAAPSTFILGRVLPNIFLLSQTRGLSKRAEGVAQARLGYSYFFLYVKPSTAPFLLLLVHLLPSRGFTQSLDACIPFCIFYMLPAEWS